LRGVLYHCYNNNVLWGSKGRTVYHSNDLGKTWTAFIKIRRMKWYVTTPLVGRLTRNRIHNIIPIDVHTLVVVVKKAILVFRNGELITEIDVPNGSRPLRQGIVAKGNSIIFGDYFSNKNRDTVRVYKANIETGNLSTLLSFENTRHVHFIQRDIVNPECLLIGTGDLDHESAIYYYNTASGELSCLGRGSQDWRAVSVLQSNDSIIWGTDCPYMNNSIIRFDRFSKTIEKVQTIAGPAYYSTINQIGEMYIGTTVEDRKIHQAIIYKSVDGNYWEPLKVFRKDIFPEFLFGFGTIEFIGGQEKLETLFYNAVGLTEA